MEKLIVDLSNPALDPEKVTKLENRLKRSRAFDKKVNKALFFKLPDIDNLLKFYEKVENIVKEDFTPTFQERNEAEVIRQQVALLKASRK